MADVDHLFPAASRHVVIHEPARMTTRAHHHARRWLVLPGEEAPQPVSAAEPANDPQATGAKPAVEPEAAPARSRHIQKQRRKTITQLTKRLNLNVQEQPR